MQLIFKANKVAHPGSRGAKFWIDEHGNTRYDERPQPKPLKYIATIVLSDGTKKYITPEKNELDENGQLKGGQAAVREIMNRELFGEYGFKADGTFWKRVGILLDYRVRTANNGKVVVDTIHRHDGYQSIEFRDGSVSRAYGTNDDGTPKLPAKITRHAVAPAGIDLATGEVTTEGLPKKPDADEPSFAGTSDVPVDEIGRQNPPKRLPETAVALGEKLSPDEDPISIASAYLAAFLAARKPSQAKTEAGREKARAERKGQFDTFVGKRQIAALPAWAVNKFDSEEELMHELGRANDMQWTESFKDKRGKLQTAKKRAEGGHPLTTLVTLGLWNPDGRNKRVTEQLLKEWSPYIRRQARRYANVYSGTDSYRGASDGDKKTWMRDRERDLYNHGVAVLLHAANTYVSNDEAQGPMARFDNYAKNQIAGDLRRMSREAAFELGATAIEDMSEEESYRAPKTISPRDHFELRHYGPKAREILKQEMAKLPEKERLAFESRLWFDDEGHPSFSEERRFEEAREKQRLRTGSAEGEWERPWTRTATEGVTSVADRLAEQHVKLRTGQIVRLGDLKPQHQTYYLNQWFEDARAHIGERLKTTSGGLTPDGFIVDKYLRLEAKLAHVNSKEIGGRRNLPIAEGTFKPQGSTLEHVRAREHPSVTFFRNNQDLARKLGVTNDLDVPLTLRNVKHPTSLSGKVRKLEGYHQLHENLKKVPNLAPVLRDAHAAIEQSQSHGHWGTDAHGNASWEENEGVVALHEAALKLHASHGEDAEALSSYTRAANNLGSEHPMVSDYTGRLKTLGMDVPTNNDLASWKAHSHAQHRDVMNRMHVIEFANAERTTKKSFSDLDEAFVLCANAYEQLFKVMQ